MTVRAPVPPRAHPDRLPHALAAGAALAVIVASVAMVDDGPHPEGAPPSTLCLLRRMTGVPCPTCGMTRAFVAMGRGDVVAAARHHPLGPVAFVAMAAAALRSGDIAITGRRRLTRLTRRAGQALAALAVAAVGWWLVRLAWMAADGSLAAAWRASPLARWLGAE